MTPLIGSFAGVVLGWAMGLLSVFLVLLVLVQRGRGGGLTGALGGPGGQSAFGTKAGDMFTKITSFTALGWIALCAYTMWLLGAPPVASIAPPPAVEATPATAGETAPFDLDSLANPPAEQGAAADGSGSGLSAPANEQPSASGDAPATDVGVPAAPADAPAETTADDAAAPNP